MEPREFVFSLGLLFPYCLSMVTVCLVSAHIFRTVRAGGRVGVAHIPAYRALSGCQLVQVARLFDVQGRVVMLATGDQPSRTFSPCHYKMWNEIEGGGEGSC